MRRRLHACGAAEGRMCCNPSNGPRARFARCHTARGPELHSTTDMGQGSCCSSTPARGGDEFGLGRRKADRPRPKPVRSAPAARCPVDAERFPRASSTRRWRGQPTAAGGIPRGSGVQTGRTGISACGRGTRARFRLAAGAFRGTSKRIGWRYRADRDFCGDSESNGGPSMPRASLGPGRGLPRNNGKLTRFSEISSMGSSIFGVPCAQGRHRTLPGRGRYYWGQRGRTARLTSRWPAGR